MAKAKNHIPFGFLHPIPYPERKLKTITMDLITLLPITKNGHTGILNVVCKVSKMMPLICLPKKVYAEITAYLFKQHIYRHHGIPLKNRMRQRHHIHEQILASAVQITENKDIDL